MKILYENTEYKITLTAIDEDPSTCTFEVTCDRSDIVNITQDGENLNEFNVVVGTLSENNEFMKLAYKVTNDNDDENITNEYAILCKENTNDELYYTKIETSTLFIRTDDYSDEDVLAKLLNVDGSGSGLDTDFLCGYSSSENSLPLSAPVSNVDGRLHSDWIYQPPDIESIIWDSEMHVIARSYILTVGAIDPQALDLTYTLLCDDATVNIVQRSGVEEHIFDITYGAYTENTNIKYTLIVSNSYGLFSTLTINKVIIKSIQLQFPVINTIFWNEETHIENHSYVMTIDAIDPSGLDLTYEVVYDPPGVDPPINIAQRSFPNEHVFDITYGEYEQNTNVSYEVIVTNTKNMTNMVNTNKLVYDTGIYIDHITWEGYANWDDCFQYESDSYVMIITATDSQSLDITYGVICDDASVVIAQRGTTNIFDITYGEYVGDANLTYTITVTNTELTSANEIKTKWVHDTNPVINNILWDDYSHDDNDSYVMNIDATDPQSQVLTYEVVCNDGTVGISQRGSTNIFDITYGEYYSDTNIQYTITVTNIDLLTDVETESITVHNKIGDRGVFAGGWDGTNHQVSIDYIAISSEGNASDFGDISWPRIYLVATSNGINDRGIFAGGRIDTLVEISTIEYITVSGMSNSINFGDLSHNKCLLASTSNGFHDRGIFAGGSNVSTEYKNIEYITISSSGNTSVFGDLSVEKYEISATSNAILGRGVFAGGDIYGAIHTNVIEYITISSIGNAINFGDLLRSLRSTAATSNGTFNRGIFAGGETNALVYEEIEYITISSEGNAANFGNLSGQVIHFSATSNGNYNRGIFAGGDDAKGGYLNTIEYITINSLGNATDFGDLTIERSGLAATSNN